MALNPFFSIRLWALAMRDFLSSSEMGTMSATFEFFSFKNSPETARLEEAKVEDPVKIEVPAPNADIWIKFLLFIVYVMCWWFGL